MADVIDLSTLGKNKTPEETAQAKFDALDEETKKRLHTLAEEAQEEPELTKVTTAFLVVVDAQGQVAFTPDLGVVQEIAISRQPTIDDVYGATAVVQKDIVSGETAQKTQALMMQTAVAAQRQASEAAMMQRLQQGGGLRG